jgi:outer membrane protein assembly factor BamA
MLLKTLLILQIVAGAGSNTGSGRIAGNDSTSTSCAIRPNEHCIVNKIHLQGNKVTKPFIITRELTFREGDTLSYCDLSKVLVKSRENLLNTSLFNFVSFDTVRIDHSRLDVTISMTERWYTWPVPIFAIADRNFNAWWLTRDLTRANYGFYIMRDNFRGRKESLSFKFQFGYSEQFGISYSIPYLNKKQTHGLGMSVAYTRNHEVAYKTLNNQLQFFRSLDDYIRNDFSARLTYSYRHGIYNKHLFETRFYSGYVADTVVALTSEYFVNDLNSMQFFSTTYEYRCDHRDSRAYPLKGYYFDLEMTKMGLGLLKNEQLDIFYVQGTIKKYMPLGKRFYFASSVKGKVSSSGRQPYSVQRALGYRDYVRAYEYYVVDGQSYWLAKAALRYELVKPQTYSLPYLRLEKFTKFHYAMYLSAFSDMGYVEDKINYKHNNLSNSLLFGTGVGLDFVTYYDTILRLEYSFNKMGEKGVFLHFASPI